MRKLILPFFVIILVVLAVAFLYLFVFRAPVFAPEVWHSVNKIDNKHYFVFVIDHSVSITKKEMQQVKRGYQDMIGELPLHSEGAIVIYGSTVEYILKMTGDHGELARKLKGIRPDGFSAMNDGIAKAIEILSEFNGRKTIVYFTDGPDDNSSFSLEQIRKMAVCEKVCVYGVGIGEMKREPLMDLSAATGGFFGVTKTYSSLGGVLSYVMTQYIEKSKKHMELYGDAIIRSFPDNASVYVDNRPVGNTPVWLQDLTEGSHSVRIGFPGGETPAYPIQIRGGHSVAVDSRASGKGRDIVIATMPDSGAVYIDGAYVGLACNYSRSFTGKDWESAVLAKEGLLTARTIPPGLHRMTLPCKPELNNGMGVNLEPLTLDFKMDSSSKKAAVIFSFLSRRVINTNLEIAGYPKSR